MLCARNYVKNLELCLQLGVLWGFYMLVFRPPRRSPQEAPGITVPLGLLGRYMRCLGFGPQALVIGACRAVQVEIFFFGGGGLGIRQQDGTADLLHPHTEGRPRIVRDLGLAAAETAQ